MAIYRAERTGNFTVISNHQLQDMELSYSAKGLLTTMLSLSPTWDFNIMGLAHIAKDGADSVRSIIRELEQLKY